MKTKFAMAGLACLLIGGSAWANDISIDAGVLPISPAAPYGHVFVHDASAFTDTIDFVVSTGSLGTSANPLNVKFEGLDVFNIIGLTYTVWGGTSGASTDWYGNFPGNNTSQDISVVGPGAYHLIVTGIANGSSGGAYGVALVSGVPEPETMALMLAGLGLVGVAVRRKKAANSPA